MTYPPVRARTLHSAIGRHGGAAGPGTTSPALIRSNPVYRIVIEDRKDDIVIGDEWRGEERKFQEARCLPYHVSLARSVSFLHLSCLNCSPFRPSLSPSVSLLHLSCLLCSPSVLPSLLSISLLPSLRCDPRWMDVCMPSCINRWTRT